MPNNKLYSEDQVTFHMTQQRQSDQSIASYCRLHGIKPSTFYSWNKRLTCAKFSPHKDTSPRFVEVPLNQKAYRSNHRIRITRTDFDIPVDSLQQVSDALQGIIFSGNSSQ